MELTPAKNVSTQFSVFTLPIRLSIKLPYNMYQNTNENYCNVIPSISMDDWSPLELFPVIPNRVLVKVVALMAYIFT